MQALLDVFQNYLQTKAKLIGKAVKEGTADQISLVDKLPQFFQSALYEQGRLDEFKVQGSFGQGVIAGVPWVGIFNRKVTTSAQNGFYIVLLFAEDMASCYLSLNQGVTAFEKQYSRKVALAKMAALAERALDHFTAAENTVCGPIDLATAGHLGKGYERGAIESYRYDIAALPSAATLKSDFLSLLHHYDALLSAAGPSLQSLAPVSETQYQQAVLEKAASPVTKDGEEYVEPPGGLPVPPKGNGGSKSGYQRDPKVAANALKKAEFKCEIDGAHKTFISSSKKLPFVEAHHLIPMSKQKYFSFSVDVSANVVALCPLCHKLLHHGRAADKREPLRKLFAARVTHLSEKGLAVTEKVLLNYYSQDVLEDEA